jgi:ribosomal protein L11 methyltransferase
MDGAGSWPWLEFAGEPPELERLMAELAGTGPSGAEEREEEDGVRLRIYWPPDGGPPSGERLEEVCALSGARLLAEGSQPREDWLAEWKKRFHPIRVSRRLWVRPPWEEFEPPDGEPVLAIEPGMAFGTGHHATTRLCLELLDERVRSGETVLDVGSGSGILAMAAVRLGAARATAVEIDPEACGVARENLRRNGLEDRVEVVEGDFAAWEGRGVDHVVCNMLLTRLRPVLPGLARAAGEGFVILSGIEEEQQGEALACLAATGLSLVETRRSEGWCAFVCRPAGDVAPREEGE